jgi:hypothetical protein
MDVKKYLFDKLIFPKTLIIDQPGIIINKIGRKYGNREVKQRTVFCFENIFANLQYETSKFLGNKKTKELWYKIGRDTMKRYLLVSKCKKPPLFMIHSILQYVFSGFCSSGFTATKNFSYDASKRKLIIEGEDNIVCRRNGLPDQFCGGISTLMTFFLNSPIEARTECDDCPNKCKIIAEPVFEKNFLEDVSMNIEEDYYSLNLPKKLINTNSYSWKDFLKFKKIIFGKNGKFYFMGKTFFAANADLFGVLFYHYKKIGKEDLLKKIVVKISKELMDDLLEKKDHTSKIDLLKNIFSVFGWGILFYKKINDSIIIKLAHPPLTKFGFNYNIYKIEGFLWSICGKRVYFNNFKIHKNPLIIELVYTLNR